MNTIGTHRFLAILSFVEIVLDQRLRVHALGKSPFGTLKLVLCLEAISLFGVSFIGGSTVAS